MPRRRKDCPIYSHLADIHQLSGETSRYYLSNAKSIGDQSECEEMSSCKRMRNKSDDEISTVSNEDVFSSSAEEGKSFEDMDESGSEEVDPLGVLIHEAAAELRTKCAELVQSFQNEGLSEIEAKKEAFLQILPALRNFANTLERN